MASKRRQLDEQRFHANIIRKLRSLRNPRWRNRNPQRRLPRVRRRSIRVGEPGPQKRFEAGDVVVLLGAPDALEAAERRMLQG